jgi:hypothetical protein
MTHVLVEIHQLSIFNHFVLKQWSEYAQNSDSLLEYRYRFEISTEELCTSKHLGCKAFHPTWQKRSRCWGNKTQNIKCNDQYLCFLTNVLFCLTCSVLDVAISAKVYEWSVFFIIIEYVSHISVKCILIKIIMPLRYHCCICSGFSWAKLQLLPFSHFLQVNMDACPHASVDRAWRLNGTGRGSLTHFWPSVL